MKKALTLIILAAVIIGGAYWLSTMTTASPAPVGNTVTTEPSTSETTPTSLVTKGPFGIMKDATGEYLTDKAGHTLYFSTKDENPKGKITPSCDATCEKSWPPFLLSTNTEAPGKSTDPLLSKLNLFQRPDGKIQYAIGTTPLYFSTLDKKPGDMTAPGNSWMIARP